MKNLLLLIVLLLAVIPTVAQDSAAAPSNSLPVTQAATDTAAAIHRLFVAKRHTYRNVSLGTIAAVGTAIAIVASMPDAESSGGGGGGGFGIIALSNSGSSNGPAIFGIALCSVPVLLVETLFCAGWSRKKERRALEAWQRHQLSAFYHRKLKPKYFQ